MMNQIEEVNGQDRAVIVVERRDGEEWAREGRGTVYRVVGREIYVTYGGSLPRYYCEMRNWSQTKAAFRIANPSRPHKHVFVDSSDELRGERI